MLPSPPFSISPLLKRELYHLALSHLYPRKSKKILNVTRGLRNAPEVLEIEAALKRAFADLPCSGYRAAACERTGDLL